MEVISIDNSSIIIKIPTSEIDSFLNDRKEHKYWMDYLRISCIINGMGGLLKMKHIRINVINKYVNEYQTFLNLLKRYNIIQDFMITYLEHETYEIEITYIER